MRKYILILLVLLGFECEAQIIYGGLDADKSSIMELRSGNKGFLLPRVKLTSSTDVSTIKNPANALMVFNTNVQSDVREGVYYYSQVKAKWLDISGANTTHSLSLDLGSGQLTGIVNGVTATTSVLAGSTNGLISLNGVVSLGGSLTKATIIATSATNTLSLSGLPKGTNTDNVVVSSAGGVLKTIPVSALKAFTSVYLNKLTSNANTLTSTINGISATTAMITLNKLSFYNNSTIMSTVNGVSATIPIVITLPFVCFKNKFINPNFIINQRGAVGDISAYEADQWFTTSSTANISLAAIGTSGGKKMLFAKKGDDISQKIEDINIAVGDYTLSWYGNVTPSSDKFTVSNILPYQDDNTRRTARLNLAKWTAGVHPQVTFTATDKNVTLSKPQLEAGLIATSFEQRAYSTELKLCQRYAQSISVWGSLSFVDKNTVVTSVQFPIEMAGVPQTYKVSGSISSSLYSDGGRIDAPEYIKASSMTKNTAFIEFDNSANKWKSSDIYVIDDCPIILFKYELK